MNWQERYVHIPYEGVCTLGDLTQALNDIWGDARSDDISGIIVDFSKTTALEMNEDDLRIIGSLGLAGPMMAGGRSFKLAFVITLPEIRQMVTMYNETYAHKQWDRRIFDDLEGAVDWVTGS